MLEYFCKASREALDYTIDFNRFLIGRESITGASAIVTAPLVTEAARTLVITRVGFTKNQVTAWLSGGEENIQYTVTVTIDTDQGRRKEQSFLIKTNGAGSDIAIVDIASTTATVIYSQ